MNKQSVWKRALSLILAASMGVGNIPVTAFAEETELTTEAQSEVLTEGSTEEEEAVQELTEADSGISEIEDTYEEPETAMQPETDIALEPETEEITELFTEQVTEEPQTDEAQETETEKEYPELTKYVQMDDGSVVGILAPEGAFPEGTVPVVEAVDLTETNPDQTYVDELLSILTEEAKEELTPENVAAYEIYFYEEEDEDRLHIQPEKPVELTFDNINVEGDELQVYHIPEKKNIAEKVNEKSENPKEGYASVKVREAKDFSVYAVVGTTKEEEEKAEQKIITIHYGATEGGSVSVEEEKVLVTFSEEGEVVKVESAEGVTIDEDGNVVRENDDSENETQDGKNETEAGETEFVLQGSTAIADEEDTETAGETETPDETIIAEEESEDGTEAEEEYVFQHWVNSKGEVVSEEETFVPEEADLIEDEEFTAVFDYNGAGTLSWWDYVSTSTPAIRKGYIYRVSPGQSINAEGILYMFSNGSWIKQSDWI